MKMSLFPKVFLAVILVIGLAIANAPQALAAAPSITLGASIGKTADIISISGSNFHNGDTVTVLISGHSGNIATSTIFVTTGSFSGFTITLPSDATEGSDIVTASDTHGNTATKAFTFDKTAPTIVSAQTKTTTTIDLIFSEDLKGTTVTNADFSVTGFTLTTPDASENNGVVTLTLSSAMTTGQTPAVNYTGSVTDLAGNIATLSSGVIPTDGLNPAIAEVTSVSTPDTDNTPNYTFSSTEAGTITYGGDCSSATTSATTGNNTITFNTLSAAIHSNCTIKVTDAAGNESSTLNVSPFTINALTNQTISFTGPSNITYGDSNPTISATATSGLAVTFSSQTSSVCTVSVPTVQILTAGTCTIRASQAGNGTYNAAPDVDQSFTVGAKTLTVSGITASNKVYDATTSATINTGSAALVGLVSSDSPTLNTGSAAGVFADVNMGTGKTVTITGLTISGASSSNYTLTQPTTTADITARPITVTANALSKAFGDSDPTLTYGLTGSLVGADSFSGSLSRATGEDVGAYSISQGSLLLNSNYTLTYAGDSFTISPKAVLTVTADNKTITYGTTDPAFTFSYSGFKNSDTQSVIDTSPACSVSGSHTDAGSYSIVCSGGSDNNYDFSYNSGTLVINPISITITADAKSKTYGANDPSLTYQITSGALINGDSLSGSLNRASGENSGTYAINQNTVNNTNYSITYVGSDLIINKADQTITFPVLSNKNVNDVDFAVTVTADSNLAVSLTSQTTPVCTITGSTVDIITTGICTLTASQAGDTNYNAALNVDQSFTVTSGGHRRRTTTTVTTSPVAITTETTPSTDTPAAPAPAPEVAAENTTGNVLGLATAPNEGSVLGANTFSFAKKIMKGSTGTDVIQLQARLANEGFFTGKADGIFGMITRKAVMAFQKKNKLKVDGILGPKTRKALNAAPIATTQGL